MKLDPNAPAFPTAQGELPMGDYVWPNPGLTIRAHFAAMAMQGMLACHKTEAEARDTASHSGEDASDVLARWAVEQSDSLIAALNK